MLGGIGCCDDVEDVSSGAVAGNATGVAHDGAEVLEQGSEAMHRTPGSWIITKVTITSMIARLVRNGGGSHCMRISKR